jgi:hypothetical protein
MSWREPNRSGHPQRIDAASQNTGMRIDRNTDRAGKIRGDERLLEYFKRVPALRQRVQNLGRYSRINLEAGAFAV